MIKMTAILKKQEGSVIIAALMVLVLLTIVGVAATSNSNFELNITTNGNLHKMAFFVAESGWHVMTSWLDRQYPLPTENLGSQWTTPFDSATQKIVDHLGFGRKNFDGVDNNGDGVIDDHAEVSEFVPFSNALTNYSHRASAEFTGASIAPGWDPTLFLRYNYAVTSTGRIEGLIRTAEQQITVTVGKVQER
jgi:hypothetical protein